MSKAIFITCILAAGPIPARALQELHEISHLAPMDGPDQREIGWQWHFVDQDGEPGWMRKVAGDDDTASYIRSDGCRWTRAVRGFAPASQWQNCPSKGTSNVTFASGKIWPLKTGNTFTYRIAGNSSLFDAPWKSKRKCRVTGQWRIKIASGEYDTFKLVCKERWGKRTWWLSPRIGTAVAYKQTSLRGDLLLQELTHIVSTNAVSETD